MIPTSRAAIALGAAAVLTAIAGVPVGLAAVAVVAAATAIDAYQSRPRPRIVRHLGRIVPRGHPVRLRVQVEASGPGRVDVRQALPPDLTADEPIGHGGIDTTLVAHRRGHHVLPGVATRVTGPLGLAATIRTDGADAEVVVFPDVVTARRIARAVATGRFTTEGARRSRILGIGTEFESIREYTPDDDIRQVNWRATARMQRPMSNQYRIDQDRDVVLLIDTARLMAAPLGRLTRLDAAVDAATAVAYTADVLSDRVGVVAFDRRMRRYLAPRRRGGDAVVDAIYDLEPTDGEANYDLAFRMVGRMKRSLVVVFTDLLEPGAARPLLDAVPVLVRRHSVIVAGSTDVDLVDAIATPPTGIADVMRVATAVDALDARETVAARLRHAGAHVLEGRPGVLAERCVRAYLDAKTRARI
jgi:uncharacterized protein (DUF58 family)